MPYLLLKAPRSAQGWLQGGEATGGPDHSQVLCALYRIQQRDELCGHPPALAAAACADGVDVVEEQHAGAFCGELYGSRKQLAQTRFLFAGAGVGRHGDGDEVSAVSRGNGADEGCLATSGRAVHEDG